MENTMSKQELKYLKHKKEELERLRYVPIVPNKEEGLL